MKHLVVASLATFALASSSAFAADMSMPMKAPAPPPPAVSWTGCYVDGGWGYGMWNQDHNISFPLTAGITSSATTTDGGRGWMGKFGGGCDYQFSINGLGNFVIGAFGDYDPMDLTGNVSPSEIFTFPGPVGTTPLTTNVKESSAWYAGARIGYLVNPSFLTYFDGGYTGTRFTQGAEYSTFSGTPITYGYPNFSDSGWFLGSGFEYALNMPWMPFHGLFLQTEYRFSEYEQRNLTETNLTTGVATGDVLNTKPYNQTITTALVWRFNWLGQ